MKKYIYTALVVATIGLSMGGCRSKPVHMPPEPKKVVTIYNSDYNSIPGTTVVNTENIRTNGVLEEYYNGVYIDPNTGDRYDQGSVHRIAESPHWNMTPNPDPKPYEVYEAYKHIKNIANATPLYAELDNKYQNTKALNRTLLQQVNVLQQTKDGMDAQQKEMSNATAVLVAYQEQNKALQVQIDELRNKMEKSETSLKIIQETTTNINEVETVDTDFMHFDNNQNDESFDN